MAFQLLKISNFRNFNSAALEPLPRGFNLIYGDNGSGKTSLLETIYYLSLGRSFRSTVAGHIIRHSADYFSIFAHVLTDSTEQQLPIGLERYQKGALKMRIAGNDAHSISELASLIPVQLINPDCYDLLEGGPIFRRRYIDWGVFYLNPEFLRIWRQFERVLKQRNAALRMKVPFKELQSWSEELIQAAESLDQCRKHYVQQLLPYLQQSTTELLSKYHLQIVYHQGWGSDMSYREALQKSYEKDTYLGYTTQGPHRADFDISINEIPAKDILSRGQQKLFVCAMIVAQGALLQDCTRKKLVYLVDDLPSELDSMSRANLVTLLSKQDTQIFVTTIEPEALQDSFTEMAVKMFHVKHGEVFEGV